MEEEQTELAILIDGNNFYKGLERSSLRSRFDINLFDYEKLATSIADDRKIAIKRYYKGVVKKELGNEKSQRMVSEQQRLFSRLEKDKWEIKRGKMSKNPEFGKCEGFYFIDREIENFDQLKTLSRIVLKKYKLCYNPIVIVSGAAPNYQALQKLFAKIKEDEKGLKTLRGIYFALNRWREKGVDVNIAVDMLDLAYSHKLSQNNLNTIAVISNDSDLKPVFERVKSLGVIVEYIGFEFKYSVALLNAADKRILLTEKELEKFLPITLKL